jgi:exonuclease III
MGSGISGNQIAPTSGEELTEGGQEAMAFPSITISAINVNSFNLSTNNKAGDKRTEQKLKAITQGNYDIILMSDCRMVDKVDIVETILQNFEYKLHSNSKNKSSRGVAIAIKNNLDRNLSPQKIADDEDGNYLLLKCKIKGRELLLGVIYGPNKDKRKKDTSKNSFYEKLISLVDKEKLPIILGGDFNTVLCNKKVPDNLDVLNMKGVPNPNNGRILRNWLHERDLCDPYRDKYENVSETSRIGFSKWINEERQPSENGESRIDFFIISKSLYEFVRDVKYDRKLSKEFYTEKKTGEKKSLFDHIEVILSLGPVSNNSDHEQADAEHVNTVSNNSDHKQADAEHVNTVSNNSDHEQADGEDVETVSNSSGHDQADEEHADTESNNSDHEQADEEHADTVSNISDHEQADEEHADTESNNSDHEQAEEEEERKCCKCTIL